MSQPDTNHPLIDYSDRYKAASDLFLHYSEVRVSSLAFLFSAFFLLVGVAITNRGDKVLLLTLCGLELVVYIIALAVSFYFTSARDHIRKFLVAMEGGKSPGLTFNYTTGFHFLSHKKWDFFNCLLVIGGIIFHVIFYSYLFHNGYFTGNVKQSSPPVGVQSPTPTKSTKPDPSSSPSPFHSPLPTKSPVGSPSPSKL